MQYNINFIDKSNFLILYNQACIETYLPNTIHNEFKVTELISYDSIQVLSTFQTEQKTFTSFDSSHSSHSSF